MVQCLNCSSTVEPSIPFGSMPIANGFLHPHQFSSEYYFELEVGFCPGCSMVQLTRLVDPTKLFHDQYAYFSSISVRMADHFRQFAAQTAQLVASNDDPFVVEIGSNDGIMLQNFAQVGVRHLGVEPSSNVAQAAVQKGVATQCSFFDDATAKEIRREHGLADAILGANVICHIPDIHSVLSGVDLLLKDDGVFIFEEPYLGDILQKTSYDQFYDEHVFYFCVSSVRHALARHGMEVVDVLPQNTHGGSMRYVIARKDARSIAPAVSELDAKEALLGLGQESSLLALKGRIEQSKDQLITLLKSLKQQGKRVVGYGATSKSTTVTNYCGIGSDLVEYISDTTPNKQGKFSPGTHIPIKSHEDFLADYPDYALLFAWNHGEEIIAKEQEFIRQGGRFISFVPRIEILDPVPIQ